jgi:hypothetical protein
MTDTTADTAINKTDIWDWATQRTRATEVKPNITLTTKDGSRVGNGIVIKEVEPIQIATLLEYLDKTNQKMYLVETDFGNRMKLSTNEILELYNLGWEQNYDEWWAERISKIGKCLTVLIDRKGKSHDPSSC